MGYDKGLFGPDEIVIGEEGNKNGLAVCNFAWRKNIKHWLLSCISGLSMSLDRLPATAKLLDPRVVPGCSVPYRTYRMPVTKHPCPLFHLYWSSILQIPMGFVIFRHWHISNTFSCPRSFDHFKPRPTLRTAIVRRRGKWRAMNHLPSRLYRAGPTADKGIMMVDAPNFAESKVIKPSNKRLITFCGHLFKYMRRNFVFRGDENGMPIFRPAHYFAIFRIVKNSFAC